jgi:hypothetical protein
MPLAGTVFVKKRTGAIGLSGDGRFRLDRGRSHLGFQRGSPELLGFAAGGGSGLDADGAPGVPELEKGSNEMQRGLENSRS